MSSTLDTDTDSDSDTGSLSDADPDFDGAAIPTDAPSRGVRWSSRLEGGSGKGRHVRFLETPKRSARRDRTSPPEAPPPAERDGDGDADATVARARARLHPRAPDDAFAMRTDEDAPVSSPGEEPHLQPAGLVPNKRPRGCTRRDTASTPPSKKRKPYDPHKDLRLGRFFRFRVDASGKPSRDDADPPRWVHGITSHRINARGQYWVLRDPRRGEYDTHEQGWAATLAQDDDARFPEPLDVARMECDGLLEYVDLHFFPHPTTPDAPLKPKPAPKAKRGEVEGRRSDRGDDDEDDDEQSDDGDGNDIGGVPYSDDENDALEALAVAAEAAAAAKKRTAPSATPAPTRLSPRPSPRTPPGLDADRDENEDNVRRLVSQLVVDESDEERERVVEEGWVSVRATVPKAEKTIERDVAADAEADADADAAGEAAAGEAAAAAARAIRAGEHAGAAFVDRLVDRLSPESELPRAPSGTPGSAKPRGRRLAFASDSEATSEGPEMRSGGTPPLPEASEPLEDERVSPSPLAAVTATRTRAEDEGGERDERRGEPRRPERGPERRPEATEAASSPASTARETSAPATSAPPSAPPSSATSSAPQDSPSPSPSPSPSSDLASTRRAILSRIDRATESSKAREKNTQDVVLRALRTLEIDRANRQHHTKMILAAVRESRERVEGEIRRWSERFRAVEQSLARTSGALDALVRAGADVASRGRDGEGNLVGPPRNEDTRGAEEGAEAGADTPGRRASGPDGSEDRRAPGNDPEAPSDPRTSRRHARDATDDPRGGGEGDGATGAGARARANGLGYGYASGFDFASAGGAPWTQLPSTKNAPGRSRR